MLGGQRSTPYLVCSADAGKSEIMSDKSDDPREHERKAREHDPHERSPRGEDEAGEPARDDAAGDAPDRPAPPGTLQQQ